MLQDAPLVVAIAGVIKAGRIAVVLSPSDPPGSLRQLLDDAEKKLRLDDADACLDLAGLFVRYTRARPAEMAQLKPRGIALLQRAHSTSISRKV